MIVEVISPRDTLFKGEATSVSLPGKAGAFTILNHHAPIVAILREGKIVIESDDGTDELEISSGFVEMHDNKVTICAE